MWERSRTELNDYYLNQQPHRTESHQGCKHLFFLRRFHCRNKQKRFNSCLVNRKEAEFTIRMPGAKEQRIHKTLEGNAGMTRQQEFEKPL